MKKIIIKLDDIKLVNLQTEDRIALHSFIFLESFKIDMILDTGIERGIRIVKNKEKFLIQTNETLDWIVDNILDEL